MVSLRGWWKYLFGYYKCEGSLTDFDQFWITNIGIISAWTMNFAIGKILLLQKNEFRKKSEFFSRKQAEFKKEIFRIGRRGRGDTM